MGKTLLNTINTSVRSQTLLNTLRHPMGNTCRCQRSALPVNSWEVEWVLKHPRRDQRHHDEGSPSIYCPKTLKHVTFSRPIVSGLIPQATKSSGWIPQVTTECRPVPKSRDVR